MIVRPAAENDLAEAAAWYENKRPGLGREFLASIDQTLEKLKQRADFGIPVHKTLRRANVPRFPYGVFYQAAGATIIVVGVFHGRRAPRVWKSRLK